MIAKGSRSKKCTLQSDSLTPAQIRKKHGKVMTYKIGQPITWTEFRSYPKEMQQKWLDAFAGRFNCGGTGVAVCFGIKASTANSYLFKKELKVPSGTGQYTEAKGEEIRAWCGTPAPAPVEPPAPQEPAPAPNSPKSTTQKPEMPYFVHTIEHGSMRLNGTSNEIFQTLFGIFRDARLTVKIDFAVVKDESETPVAELPESDKKIDLNKCSFEDLKAIGVYSNTALNIINGRPYKSMDELKNAPGVSERYFSELRKKAMVSNAE